MLLLLIYLHIPPTHIPKGIWVVLLIILIAVQGLEPDQSFMALPMCKEVLAGRECDVHLGLV